MTLLKQLGLSINSVEGQEAFLNQIPGKLFIAGEYAILQAGQAAIIMAVNQYLTCSIQALAKDQKETIIQSDLAGLSDLHIHHLQNGEIVFNQPSDSKWSYIIATYQLMVELFDLLNIKMRPCQVQFQSDLQSQSGAKYGLGSSAAVTVSFIKSLIQFHGLAMDKPLFLFKLATIASLKSASNGSMADIACISHGGWIYYRCFDRTWLEIQLTSKESLIDLLSGDWPGLIIQPLAIPSNLILQIGWTGSPASTQNLVQEVLQQAQHFPDPYYSFVEDVKDIVEGMRKALENQDMPQFLTGIQANQKALVKLGQAYQVPIETPQLQQLVADSQACGAVAKISGAGGGDCGISFTNSTDVQNQVKVLWNQHHIQALDFQTAPRMDY